MRRTARAAIVAAALVAASLAVATAAARGGDDDVRVRGTCTASSRSELRLKAHDDGIRVEFRLENGARATAWHVVLLRERRIVARALLTTRGGRSTTLRRVVADWYGVESFVARAVSRRGETCTASAAI